MESISTLHPYQAEGVEFLRGKKRILADDPGLGKSVQALFAILQSGCKNVLIVCPKTVKPSWEEEISKWLGNDHGIKFTIIGYPQLLEMGKLSAARVSNKSLAAVKWDGIIFDEAHRLRNRNAKQTKSAFSITKASGSAVLIAITGTPIINRADELWSLLHMIDPKTFSSYWKFVKENFITSEIVYGNFPVVKPVKPINPEGFKKIISPYIIRRQKSDLGYIQPTYQTIAVDLPRDQKTVYETMYKQYYAEIKTMEGTKEFIATNALARLARLRQICISPDLMDNESQEIRGAKIDALLEFLADREDKCVIFSTSSRCIKRLTRKLNSSGYKSYSFTGEDSDVVRQKNKNNFIHQPDARCMLMTIGAGGEGLNGLQHAASTVIFMDKDWTPAANRQAVGRVDRVGQEQPVNVIHFMTSGTIEKRYEKMLGTKQWASDTVLPITDVLCLMGIKD